MGLVRAEQVQATRELIMAAAERLFAEHGVAAVSARQIGEAAGQGNTAAVGYHFGTKTGLVRAILRKHTADIERIRTRMADEAAASGDVRDWVACLVRPSTDHLASLGAPTWFARFGVQVLADPQLRPLLMEETSGTPAIARVLRGINRCLAGMPAPVRAGRDDMVLALIVHVVAEHESALAEQAGEAGQAGKADHDGDAGHDGKAWHGGRAGHAGKADHDGGAGAADPWVSWDHAATGLIDALTGLYQAPVSPCLRSAATPRER